MAETLRILALGDSLTAGYGLGQSESFPVQLERALREHRPDLDVRIVNGGVSGDTTSGGLARLDWALADDPQAVILALGANDGLRAIDPEITRSNLDALLRRLGEEGLPVLLIGMLAPPNLGDDYGDAFNAIYPELAEQYADNVVFYPFFLEGVALQPALNQPDGIHPNRQGVAIMVERILPLVLRLIERI